MLGDKRGRAQANHGDKAGWGNETHHVEMMETLKHPHLAPHALLILLEFLLRNRLQCDLAHEVPRDSLAGGISRGRRGQRCSGERVGGGVWRGVDGPAAQRSARVYCSGGTCHAPLCYMR